MKFLTPNASIGLQKKWEKLGGNKDALVRAIKAGSGKKAYCLW